MRNHIAAVCGLALAIVAGGCDESATNLAGPTPNLTATFSSIQRDIFEASDSSGRPACTSCHNATGARFNGLNLERSAAYDQLVNVASAERPSVLRVSPGNPDASYLVQKLEGGPGIVGSRMPLNGPFLTNGQIAIIRRWIDDGAPRN
jgi:hypothetical protein